MATLVNSNAPSRNDSHTAIGAVISRLTSSELISTVITLVLAFILS